MYRSTGNGWDLITRAGPLLLLKDNKQEGSLFLRLLDLFDGNETVQWEHELWYGFQLACLEPYFYAFESDVPTLLFCSHLITLTRNACMD